jgi:hypothetical protein
VLTGSANLTAPAHSHGRAGNLEAAFLVDITELRSHGWWLKSAEVEPETYADRQVEESAESTKVFVDIAFQYDWQSDRFSYRRDGSHSEPVRVSEPEGRKLFVIDRPRPGRWTELPSDITRAVRELLPSTSFLQVSVKSGSWRVLVREEGMNYKPSILTTLSPEEILLYWSLLSPAQREAFLLEKAVSLEPGDFPTVRGNRYATGDTVFDRFAGVYHAFEMLRRSIDDAIERGDEREAEARLFGKKYDSLPVLLEQTLDRIDGDPVMQYVTFLSAKQARDCVRRSQPEFWKNYRSGARCLDELLERLPSVRCRLGLAGDTARQFFDWYERMFLKIAQPLEFNA